jgi:hypothetical protein
LTRNVWNRPTWGMPVGLGAIRTRTLLSLLMAPL